MPSRRADMLYGPDGRALNPGLSENVNQMCNAVWPDYFNKINRHLYWTNSIVDQTRYFGSKVIYACRLFPYIFGDVNPQEYLDGFNEFAENMRALKLDYSVYKPTYNFRNRVLELGSIVFVGDQPVSGRYRETMHTLASDFYNTVITVEPSDNNKAMYIRLASEASRETYIESIIATLYPSRQKALKAVTNSKKDDGIAHVKNRVRLTVDGSFGKLL